MNDWARVIPWVLILGTVTGVEARRAPFSDWMTTLERASKAKELGSRVDKLTTERPQFARAWFYGFVFDLKVMGIPSTERERVSRLASRIADRLAGPPYNDVRPLLVYDMRQSDRLALLGDSVRAGLQCALELVNDPNDQGTLLPRAADSTVEAIALFYMLLHRAELAQGNLNGRYDEETVLKAARRIAETIGVFSGDLRPWRALAEYMSLPEVPSAGLPSAEEAVTRAMNAILLKKKTAVALFRVARATLSRGGSGLRSASMLGGEALAADIAGAAKEATALRAKLSRVVSRSAWLSALLRIQTARAHLEAGRLEDFHRVLTELQRSPPEIRTDLAVLELYDEAAVLLEKRAQKRVDQRKLTDAASAIAEALSLIDQLRNSALMQVAIPQRLQMGRGQALARRAAVLAGTQSQVEALQGRFEAAVMAQARQVELLAGDAKRPKAASKAGITLAKGWRRLGKLDAAHGAADLAYQRAGDPAQARRALRLRGLIELDYRRWEDALATARSVDPPLAGIGAAALDGLGLPVEALTMSTADPVAYGTLLIEAKQPIKAAKLPESVDPTAQAIRGCAALHANEEQGAIKILTPLVSHSSRVALRAGPCLVEALRRTKNASAADLAQRIDGWAVGVGDSAIMWRIHGMMGRMGPALIAWRDRVAGRRPLHERFPGWPLTPALLVENRIKSGKIESLQDAVWWSAAQASDDAPDAPAGEARKNADSVQAAIHAQWAAILDKQWRRSGKEGQLSLQPARDALRAAHPAWAAWALPALPSVKSLSAGPSEARIYFQTGLNQGRIWFFAPKKQNPRTDEIADLAALQSQLDAVKKVLKHAPSPWVVGHGDPHRSDWATLAAPVPILLPFLKGRRWPKSIHWVVWADGVLADFPVETLVLAPPKNEGEPPVFVMTKWPVIHRPFGVATAFEERAPRAIGLLGDGTILKRALGPLGVLAQSFSLSSLGMALTETDAIHLPATSSLTQLVATKVRAQTIVFGRSDEEALIPSASIARHLGVRTLMWPLSGVDDSATIAGLWERAAGLEPTYTLLFEPEAKGGGTLRPTWELEPKEARPMRDAMRRWQEFTLSSPVDLKRGGLVTYHPWFWGRWMVMAL